MGEQETCECSLTLDFEQEPGLRPEFTWGCAQPATATTLCVLLLHWKSPDEQTGQKASSESPREMGKGWGPYNVWQDVYLRWAGWMHRTSHLNKCSATCEHVFRLISESSSGFQPCRVDPNSRCTVPRPVMLLLSTVVMKLPEVKWQANVLQFSLQIWFWFHLNGSMPNCLPIVKT